MVFPTDIIEGRRQTRRCEIQNGLGIDANLLEADFPGSFGGSSTEWASNIRVASSQDLAAMTFMIRLRV
jgi:hypothetical protein